MQFWKSLARKSDMDIIETVIHTSHDIRVTQLPALILKVWQWMNFTSRANDTLFVKFVVSFDLIINIYSV